MAGRRSAGRSRCLAASPDRSSTPGLGSRGRFCCPAGSPARSWIFGRKSRRARRKSADAMAPILEVEGLSKAFGGLIAVNNISLSVSPGEVLGLIGPNGSGKTTLLNLIAGAIRPDAGVIRMDGEDVTRLPNHLRVRKRINRTFQLVRMPPNMP